MWPRTSNARFRNSELPLPCCCALCTGLDVRLALPLSQSHLRMPLTPTRPLIGGVEASTRAAPAVGSRTSDARQRAASRPALPLPRPRACDGTRKCRPPRDWSFVNPTKSHPSLCGVARSVSAATPWYRRSSRQSRTEAIALCSISSTSRATLKSRRKVVFAGPFLMHHDLATMWCDHAWQQLRRWLTCGRIATVVGFAEACAHNKASPRASVCILLYGRELSDPRNQPRCLDAHSSR